MQHLTKIPAPVRAPLAQLLTLTEREIKTQMRMGVTRALNPMKLLQKTATFTLSIKSCSVGLTIKRNVNVVHP